MNLHRVWRGKITRLSFACLVVVPFVITFRRRPVAGPWRLSARAERTHMLFETKRGAVVRRGPQYIAVLN